MEKREMIQFATDIALEIAVAGIDMDDYLDIQGEVVEEDGTVDRGLTPEEEVWVRDNWERFEKLALSVRTVIYGYVERNWK